MPWADALFFHDLQWWTVYEAEVRASFNGLLASASRVVGVKHHGSVRYPNSGCEAVSFAALRGSRRMVLLGYDCQKTNGEAHHHGDHPRGLGNAGSVAKWPPMFRYLAADMSRLGAKVINASRVTALTVFERQSLESALAQDAVN